jgi:hypothetical protein
MGTMLNLCCPSPCQYRERRGGCTASYPRVPERRKSVSLLPQCTVSRAIALAISENTFNLVDKLDVMLDVAPVLSCPTANGQSTMRIDNSTDSSLSH